MIKCEKYNILFSSNSFQIYPDPESEKAIMGSLVFCIHHKQGCKWSDELRKLKVRNRIFFVWHVKNNDKVNRSSKELLKS